MAGMDNGTDNDKIKDIASLQRALELDGHETVKIGETTFAVFLNGTRGNETFFVDGADILKDRFILADSAGRSKKIDFSDDQTLNWMAAVKRAEQAAQAA
ncbi:MAG TPA: hypothetical protein PLR75_04095 [Candidatus Pacearchaeota archaeon]|nr:hypothetical protein [Candidatus Pacearchaeota archaeon]